MLTTSRPEEASTVDSILDMDYLDPVVCDPLETLDAHLSVVSSGINPPYLVLQVPANQGEVLVRSLSVLQAL